MQPSAASANPAGTNLRQAVTAASILVLLMAGHAMLETARDALFLERLPVSQLPWTYIAIAGSAVLAARLNGRLVDLVNKRLLLVLTLAALATVTVGFWALFSLGHSLVAHAFYVWTGVVATLTVVQFWLLLADLFTVTEAKRLYALIAAGGLVGAALGSGLSELMLRWAEPRHLLLGGAALLVAAGLVPGVCRRQEIENEEDALETKRRREVPEGEQPRPDSYLRGLLALGLVSSIALTIVDYVFKSSVAQHVEPAQWGQFFARFYLALNLVALAVQVVISPRLLRALGANRALLVLPAMLVIGSGGFVVAAGLIPMLLLKAADGSFRHALHRSAVELLYLPLPRSVRDHCKGSVEAMGHRGGQAIASLGILGVLALGANLVHLVVAIGVFSVLWMASALRLKRHYLDMFRQHLRDGAIETRVDVPELDLHSLEALMSSLNSEHDEEVLATVDLLAAYQKHHLIPVLLLYHPSQAVVLRTLDLLASAPRRDFVSVAKRLLQHEDSEVRTAAMHGLAKVLPEDELRGAATGDGVPAVRAAALVALVSRGHDTSGRFRQELNDCVVGAEQDPKVGVARAIRYQGDAQFGDLLEALARDSDPSVRHEVARAMETLAEPRFATTLIGMLAHRGVRPTARDALSAMGTSALDALEDALSDQRLPRKVRVNIPRTLAHFGVPRAAEILLRRFSEEEDGLIRFKILRGLGRLRPVLRDTALDRKLILSTVRSTLNRAVQMLSWWIAAHEAQEGDSSLKTAGGELLLAVLKEKEQNALDRVLRLASLLHVEEDFRPILLGLRNRNRRLRAESRELLENLLENSMGSTVAALLDDLRPAQRLARASELLGDRPTNMAYAARLRVMLRDPSEAVRCVAAYHIGELGLTEMDEHLKEARPEGVGFLADVIDRVRAGLGPPALLRGAHVVS